MSRFAMVTEDPSYMYDEDGFCVDEDANWQDVKEEQEVSREKPEACYIMDCDPFSTINS